MKSKMSDKGRFKRKRGTGEFENYVPWIWVTDFSSVGLRVRVLGLKTKRLHHLLSLLETRVFYILESLECVIDIREQYPLLPLSETLEIAEQNNIKHPKLLGIPIVRTTDFLVITKTKTIAISVKYREELKKKRVLEKLEIESQYWERRGVEFMIITEYDISENAYKNAERFRGFSNRPSAMISNEEFIEKMRFYSNVPQLETIEVLKKIAHDINESVGTVHHLFLHLLFIKTIRFDINKCIAIRSKISDLCL